MNLSLTNSFSFSFSYFMRAIGNYPHVHSVLVNVQFSIGSCNIINSSLRSSLIRHEPIVKTYINLHNRWFLVFSCNKGYLYPIDLV